MSKYLDIEGVNLILQNINNHLNKKISNYLPIGDAPTPIDINYVNNIFGGEVYIIVNGNTFGLYSFDHGWTWQNMIDNYSEFEMMEGDVGFMVDDMVYSLDINIETLVESGTYTANSTAEPTNL